MGYRSIRCRSCGRSPKSGTLIVIGGMIYCRHCLRNIKVKDTKLKGKYYTHSGNRCFVNFESNKKINIQEFDVKELRIGGRKQ
ncbi:hypothetical protein [Crassaminicella profunda]|uniref:hypothetical protein n=1 Tax=Crassaminicella profunda TaxID=1286698 RepID=UPI001CA66A69|nr:hypothetical protein [Crassaminicella profunda]QZY56688.1 hypothetical protein K7H06_07145 [Crassaminicella profunda]